MNFNSKVKSGEHTCDVCIVGGGITGLAIAREAAERGLSVILIEKDDFGHATSAATSKLIHGGLRYLENFEIGLVRESLRERRVLSCAAGHLVKPLSFLIPAYPWNKPGRFLMRMGLWTYDVLSFDRNHHVPDDKRMPASRYLSKKEITELEPRIDSPELKGGFQYYDAQSLHPERLSIAFLKSAVEKNAVAWNHAKATGFITEEKNGRTKVLGVEVQDTISGNTASIRSKIVINASGPWMDLVLKLLKNKTPVSLQRSKGIHLITDKVLGNNAVFFRTKTGRHFFVVPWQGYSIIGPTDKPFTDHPDNLEPTEDDVDELFNDINDTIPGSPLQRNQIRQIPIGIRPLIFSGKSTYRASRKYEIYNHADQGIDRLMSVAGGKWTTSRQLGEDVILQALKTETLNDLPVHDVDTSVLPLYGSPGFGNPADVYTEFALRLYGMPELPEANHRHLIEIYGTEHTEVLKLLQKNPALAKPLWNEHPDADIQAQVLYAVEKEGAQTLSDILLRRTAAGTLGCPDTKTLESAARLAAKPLKWNASRIKKEVNDYLAGIPLDLIERTSGNPAAKGTLRVSAKKSTAAKKTKKTAKKSGKKAAKKTAAKTVKKSKKTATKKKKR